MKSFKLSRHAFSPIALALAAALALPAFAQTATDPTMPADTPSVPVTMNGHSGTKSTTFNDLDTNNDGRLSRDEVVGDTELSRNFDAIDTNKDGYISKDELRAYEEQRKR
ncbi:MAG TPA: EF-hand domain-containing protein [Xanthomonadaceae bacterium]|nr:EF-hand domain-containing protein [Xanthomonadaceae bacterium]